MIYQRCASSLLGNENSKETQFVKVPTYLGHTYKGMTGLSKTCLLFMMMMIIGRREGMKQQALWHDRHIHIRVTTRFMSSS